MTSFRFRLERVLDFYRDLCAIEERQLAGCLSALNDVRESIAKLQAERTSIDRDFAARETIGARELVSLGLYRLRASHLAAELHQQSDCRQAEVDAQRATVQEARRRVRLVENLRQRRHSEHVYEENR